MISGFRIIEFSLKIFGEQDMKISLNNSNLEGSEFGATVIIGENGCGKTEILINLIKVFNFICNIKSGKKPISLSRSDIYYIKYYLNGDIYEINIGDCFTYKKNNEVTDINEINLPMKFIVQSFSYGDRFPYKSDEKYKYLGTKTTSNASYISHIENSIIEILCCKNDKVGFNEFVSKLFKFVGLSNKFTIRYNIESYKRIDEVMANYDNFNKYYDEFLSSSRRMNYDIKKFVQQFTVMELYERIVSLLYDHGIRNDRYEYTMYLDNNTREDINKIKSFYSYLRLLSYMKILSSPKVVLYKYGSEFSIEYASSGEKQIIYSLLNIFSEIEESSLVIIDEPEISLHPNWQMKYMNFLEKMFIDFYNCHFVIATHSHFMISDIKKENSNIIVMNRRDEGIIAKKYDLDTFSWSAEDILYNVFSVPSNRNYYVARDVEDVLSNISSGKNISDDTRIKMDKLKSLLQNLKDTDPLKTIILKIMERNFD